MRPHAHLSLHRADAAGEPMGVVLGPGDLIGRLPGVALHLVDPRISEAHAMVSLRSGELVLLALRRRFLVDGSACSQLVLEPGVALELAEGITLHCVEVTLPTEVLALRADGLPDMPLPPVCTLVAGSPPRVIPSHTAGGTVIWSEAERFLCRQGEAPPQVVRAGDRFTVEGVVFTVIALPLRTLMATQTASLERYPPLTFELFYDVVRVHRSNEPRVTIQGVGARLVSELAALRQPVAWQTVAREVWEDGATDDLLRRRFDMALGRLRHRLRGAGLPPHLVHTDGLGNVELHVRPEDTVQDHG